MSPAQTLQAKPPHVGKEPILVLVKTGARWGRECPVTQHGSPWVLPSDSQGPSVDHILGWCSPPSGSFLAALSHDKWKPTAMKMRVVFMGQVLKIQPQSQLGTVLISLKAESFRELPFVCQINFK